MGQRAYRAATGAVSEAVMEFAGFGHICLVVSKFEDCVKFYDKVMDQLGMKPYIVNPLFKGWFAKEAMFVIAHAAPDGDAFSQWRTGLHHLSFRARSRAEVDSFHELLKRIGAKVIHPAEEGPFWPGYYSVVCEDPDGIRIEMNYIPEHGWKAVAQAAGSIARKS